MSIISAKFIKANESSKSIKSNETIKSIKWNTCFDSSQISQMSQMGLLRLSWVVGFFDFIGPWDVKVKWVKWVKRVFWKYSLVSFDWLTWKSKKTWNTWMTHKTHLSQWSQLKLTYLKDLKDSFDLYDMKPGRCPLPLRKISKIVPRLFRRRAPRPKPLLGGGKTPSRRQTKPPLFSKIWAEPLRKISNFWRFP